MSNKSKINKMKSIVDKQQECIDLCKKHNQDLNIFNLKDNIKDVIQQIDTLDNDSDLTLYDIKELNKSLKYYQSVYNKLLYIEQLKNIVENIDN